MDRNEVISGVAEHMKEKFKYEGSGHDWWHINRVWDNAKQIGLNEGDADMFIVELAALLHDIDDFKLHDGDSKVGANAARKVLENFEVDEGTISHVCDIVETVSFKGAGVEREMSTKEGKIVRDADRLDAIGAIGIARCFTYGGSKGTAMHNPEIKPKLHNSVEEYVAGWNGKGTQINHFHEKLLLLKDLMLTQTGKKIAESRHKFMEKYLEQFYSEWDGKN